MSEYTHPPDSEQLFSAAALAALHTPGIVARWNAVQQQLHPELVVLTNHIRQAVQQHLPRLWPRYEVSYKSQRYVNRGRGERAPIDDYHLAFDRPPRGAGVLVAVSGAERAILVGLQLWRVRKEHLREVWETGRHIWQPLVARIEQTGAARFAGQQRGPSLAAAAAADASLWLDHYLHARQAGYLWAGFVYPWDDLPPNLAERLTSDVLALLPFNEAIMEQAEAYEPSGAALLREQRADYRVTTPMPSIDTIISRIRERGFAISDTLLRAYHVALQTRPLVILPGISGTGKTWLTRLYADAVHGVAAEADNPYYRLIAVRPDWHNASDLLGYYNAISGRYHPTPFLRFLLRAAADPQQPYYVCLDEMNLARPEYYLAPLLSALETTDHRIDLGIPAETVETVTGETLRSPLPLPLNVRLIGTVNVDESTYPLSDKLLDRANVIELTDVNLPAFRAVYRGPLDDTVWQTIVALHAIVTRAGQPFGYRTIAEMLRYVEQAAGILTPQHALDVQIKQKILPRLRGADTPRLRRGLTELRALLDDPAAPLAESAATVQRMQAQLDHDGFIDLYYHSG